MTRIRGQVTSGTTALRESRPSKAAAELVGAQAAVQGLLSTLDGLKVTLASKARAADGIANMKRIGTDENRDVDSAVTGPQGLLDQGETLLGEGKIAEAQKAFADAASAIEAPLVKLVDELVSRYSVLAKSATDVERYADAELALTRAKQLAAMKPPTATGASK